MSLPARTQQVAVVASFLDSDKTEGRSLEDVASDIVDGYLEALTAKLKKPASPLHEGMLIKSPWDGKVRRVAWIGDDSVWVVQDNSNYGWLGPSSPPIWEYCEEYVPKRRIEVDGKGKLVEMTIEEIAEDWRNPEWSVGELLSRRQRQFLYEVIAVAPQCVLMRDQKSGMVMSDSNHNLERYYHRERERIQGVDDW